MPIQIQDAIERADVMAGDDGLLSQHSYDLLAGEVTEEDRHAFTMALVDRGIRVRSMREKRSKKAILSGYHKLMKLAQAVDYDEDEDFWGEDQPEAPEEQPTDSAQVSQIRDILENAGIAVANDGMVSFYQSSVPGLYKEKLPQALPLQVAAQFWEQRLNISDREKEKAEGLQNILSQLKQQTKQRAQTRNTPKLEVIEATLDQMSNYGFDPRSKSQTTQSISNGIEEVFNKVMSGDFIRAASAIDEIQELLEVYGQDRLDNYEIDLAIWDALDKLNAMQAEDPESFSSVISGLGGISARFIRAWYRAAQYFNPPGDEPPIIVEIGVDYIRKQLQSLMDWNPDFAGKIENSGGVDGAIDLLASKASYIISDLESESNSDFDVVFVSGRNIYVNSPKMNRESTQRITTDVASLISQMIEDHYM